jgi:anti-sigma factor RsiW
MKEPKFIELLNLYLDQQIEPADAALLEEEIARNPARRRIYQQYCRMHRACTTMFEQSSPSGSVGVKLAMAAAAADEKIQAFPAPRRSYAWIGYGAGLAAAACGAFVFLSRSANVPVASARDEIVQITPARALPAGKSASTAVSAANYQPVMVAHSVRLAPDSNAIRTAGDESPSLDWMRQVQFVPVAHVSAEELVFEPHPKVDIQNDQKAFHSRLPFQGDVEKAAFQFQR